MNGAWCKYCFINNQLFNQNYDIPFEITVRHGFMIISYHKKQLLLMQDVYILPKIQKVTQSHAAYLLTPVLHLDCQM